jgi:hypothetical protein
MLQSIILYLVLWSTSGNEFIIVRDDKFLVYSNEPVIYCTAEKSLKTVTKEKTFYLYCKTERLYYFMTGKDTTEIVITGAYNA